MTYINEMLDVGEIWTANKEEVKTINRKFSQTQNRYGLRSNISKAKEQRNILNECLTGREILFDDGTTAKLADLKSPKKEKSKKSKKKSNTQKKKECIETASLIFDRKVCSISTSPWNGRKYHFKTDNDKYICLNTKTGKIFTHGKACVGRNTKNLGFKYDWIMAQDRPVLYKEMLRLGRIYTRKKEELAKINRRWGVNKKETKKDPIVQQLDDALTGRVIVLPDGRHGEILPMKKPVTPVKGSQQIREECEIEFEKIFGRKATINRQCDEKLQYHFPIKNTDKVICLDFGGKRNFGMYVHKSGGDYHTRVFGFIFKDMERWNKSGKLS